MPFHCAFAAAMIIPRLHTMGSDELVDRTSADRCYAVDLPAGGSYIVHSAASDVYACEPVHRPVEPGHHPG